MFLVGTESQVIEKLQFDASQNWLESVGRFIGHSNSVRNINMSPDNKFVLSSCEDHSLRLWNFETYEP